MQTSPSFVVGRRRPCRGTRRRSSGDSTVGRSGQNGSVSDDAGGLSVRQGPRKRAGDARVADFALLVLVPGQSVAVKVFTNDEADEADQDAAASGGAVVSLTLSRRQPAMHPGRTV